MSKDRNIICRHYERAGVCAISKKKCMVFKEMQHCDLYEPLKGSKPIRTDNRIKKKNDAARKEHE